MADKRTSPKNKLLFLVLLAAVGLVALLYFRRETLSDTWDTLRDADLRFVILLPIIQVVNYLLVGTYYRKMFAAFGAKITVARSWGVVAAMNFVNQVLPSGGLSGITYLAYGFRSSIETGKTTLIQLGRYIFAFLAYAIITPFALLMLVQEGRFDEFSEVMRTTRENSGYMVILGIFIAFVVLLGVLMTNRRLASKIGDKLLAAISWIKMHIFRKKTPATLEPLKKLNQEFYEGIGFIRSKGWRTITPAVYMLLSAFAELAIVYVSMLAVSADVSLGAVFIAFVAANIVGVVSIIPGDVGVHELTVIIVLSAFGVPESVAVSATLLYRVFNKLIFLPIGFYFYQKILKPALEQ